MSTSPASGRDPSRPVKMRMLIVFMAAAVQATGLQAITPALPAMQKALALNNSQIALVTTAYLLPTSLLALPMGAVADRFGRRVVLSSALLALGLGGGAIVLVQTSPILILVCRILQGAAVAALLPVTITIIGDSLTGSSQVRAQAWRNVTMKIGGTLLPAVGGVLAGIAWHAAFLLQLVAIPLGIAALMTIPSNRGEARAGHKTGGFRHILTWSKNSSYMALAIASFMRLFLSFSVLTYLPILVVTRGMSAVVAGVALSVSAAVGTFTALGAAWFSQRLSATVAIFVCQVALITAIIILATASSTAVVILGVILHGFADGPLSVLLNSLASSAAPTGLRGTFIGVMGSVKNFGKFAAPALMGAATVLVSLGHAYFLIAGMGFAGLIVLPLISRLEAQIRSLEADG